MALPRRLIMVTCHPAIGCSMHQVPTSQQLSRLGAYCLGCDMAPPMHYLFSKVESRARPKVEEKCHRGDHWSQNHHNHTQAWNNQTQQLHTTHMHLDPIPSSTTTSDQLQIISRLSNIQKSLENVPAPM